MKWFLLVFIIGCRSEKNEQADDAEEGTDVDLDGFTLEDGDCDDGNSAINAGEVEICDGIDNNCDGTIDEDVQNIYYVDSDQDGFGNPEISIEACQPPTGFVENGDDCNDTNADAYPGAEEICDNLDNNCDGTIDEDVLNVYYTDSDEDGFGNAEIFIEACESPTGFVENSDDCNDTNADAYPGAEEICDNLDNNCDGTIDEDVLNVYYTDSDEDGFGNAEIFIEACEPPTGFVENSDDCNDTNADAYPGAEEICDNLDNNCNDEIDEGARKIFYLDGDGDGFGDDDNTLEACEQPPEYVEISGDCDDMEIYVNPFAMEFCDGMDNDCDGDVDEAGSSGEVSHYVDTDGDGFGDDSTLQTSCDLPVGNVLQGGDCDDTKAYVNPATIEICDGMDNDCDSNVDEAGSFGEVSHYVDTDGDGFGDDSTLQTSCDLPVGNVLQGGDCDDTKAYVNPATIEICDGMDNDCDGDIDLGAIDPTIFYQDADLDGYGDPTVSEEACSPSAGFVDNAEDCDDDDNTVNPAASESCDGEDNDCDGDVDEEALGMTLYFFDADLDGYGDPTVSEEACSPSAGFVDNAEDCDDDDEFTYPGAAEVEAPQACMTDADEDGWGAYWPATGIEAGSDCDDSDSSTSILLSDADCDGVPADEDCDDNDATILGQTDDIDCDGWVNADDNCPYISNPSQMDSDENSIGDPCDNLSSLVPVLSSNTSASPIVVASDTQHWNQNLAAWKAFNNNWNGWPNGFCWEGTSGWLMIDLGAQTEVQYYEIRGRDDMIVSSPLEWTFEGSNDNSNWTVLDLRSEQDSWVQGEHVAFHLLNPQSWRYFRIVATGNPGGYSITCFQEMALYGP